MIRLDLALGLPLQVWKWRTGECRVLQGHKEQVRRFLFLTSSPDLLSWSYDGTVKVGESHRPK